jgi:hypothetical protein
MLGIHSPLWNRSGIARIVKALPARILSASVAMAQIPSGLAGTYISVHNANDRLTLGPYGTYSLDEKHQHVQGHYTVENGILTLKLGWPLKPLTAKIDGGTIVDRDGVIWKKEPDAAVDSVPTAVQSAPSASNAEIIRMLQAALPESVILGKIRSTPQKFDTSADALIQLKQAGASEAVLTAIVEATGSQSGPVKNNKPIRSSEAGTNPVSSAPLQPKTPVDQEASQFIAQHFTRCGDSYFMVDYAYTMWTGTREFRGLHWAVQPLPVSDADRLNGITIRAKLTLSATAFRTHPRSGSWSQWRPGFSTFSNDMPNVTGIGNGLQNLDMVLSNGRWQVSGSMEIENSKSRSCSDFDETAQR